jgi:hypothetical protein
MPFNLSTSKISLFKTCRKKYWFKYIAGIEFEKSQALIDGTNYHESVGKILKGEPVEHTPLSYAFKKFISIPPVKQVEKSFNIRIAHGVYLKGFIDAICEDGTPVEHKTTKNKIDEKYIYFLNWDEQVSTYLAAMSLMYRKPFTKIIYTVCQKPTIRQRMNETTEEYNKRCFDWYDETKAKSFTVVRTAIELDSWLEEMIFLAKEMKRCKTFYRNPNACKFMGCEYQSICLDHYGEELKN